MQHAKWSPMTSWYLIIMPFPVRSNLPLLSLPLQLLSSLQPLQSLQSLPPLMPLLLPLLFTLLSTTDATSIAAELQSKGATRNANNEVAWSEFSAAAVLGAPKDAHLVVMSSLEPATTSASLFAATQAAWSVPRDIVNLACTDSAFDITWGANRQLKEAGALLHRNRIVLLLCSLEEVISLLKQVADESLEVVWLRWVVLTTTEGAASTLQRLLRTGAQVTVVEHRRHSDQYNIFTSAPHQDYTIRLRHVGSWRSGYSVSRLGSLIYPPPDAHYKDMKGWEFRVAVVNNWPFFGFVEDSNGTVTPTSGIDHSVFDAVSKALNFKYRVVPGVDGKWGGPQPDGSVTGMIGMVARHDVDFTIDEITITEQRETVVDFTQPYYTESAILMNRAPGEMPRPLVIFSPFTKIVWGSLVAITFAISMAVFALQRSLSMLLSPLNKTRQPHNSATEVLFNMYRSIVIQGNYLDMSHTTLRIALCAWFLFCMIVYALYAGTLTASLVRPSLEKPINTLEELYTAVKEQRLRPVIFEETSVSSVFLAAEEGGLYNGLSEAAVRLSSTTTAKDMVLAGTGIILTGETWAVIAGGPDYFIGRERFYMENYGIACPSGSPFTLQINPLLGRMVAAGLIQKWKDEEMAKMVGVRPPASNTERVLTLTQLQGVFMLYGIGMSIAALTLLLELAWK